MNDIRMNTVYVPHGTYALRPPTEAQPGSRKVTSVVRLTGMEKQNEMAQNIVS